MRSLFALALTTVALAAPSGDSSNNQKSSHETSKAAYFLDNDPAGSSIVSIRIDESGMLRDSPVRTSTRGNGAIGMNSTGFKNTADSLFSQDAVVVSGEMMFTINPGSSTIVMFRINPSDPYHPTMVGSPASTIGEFPMSVTYSAALRTVCVMNGGAKAGVACFSADPFYGLKPVGPLRSIGKAIDETTPATGPPGSASDIFFTPDSSAVLVTTKGDAGSTPPKQGYFATFPVKNGKVANKPVLSQISDILMQFSITWLDEFRFLLSDPAYGVSILSIAHDFTLTELAHTKIPNEVAICWTSYDPALSMAYAIDVGQPYLTKINPSSGAIEGRINIDKNLVGMFDSSILNDKMYSLSGVNGIVVTDLVKEKQAQFLDLTGFGERAFYQGMAVWPKM
ncbi:Hypothetical protein R9X50_00357700 [Acrodontium crateriforme]|uniref:Uncharacterized protein n=1 Tax=Acrodontium crateriforme TaxID=150365 RepID=A0AAQ3M2S7_9PEZI|nr:Hypothetical protein R9X50_00357700 [Acrodontium crateriforme]